MNAIGVPDIADGETIRDDVIAGLHASLDSFERCGMRPSRWESTRRMRRRRRLVELASSVLRYADALWTLLYRAPTTQT